MGFVGSLKLSIDQPSIPLEELCRAWTEADFEPAPCRDLLEGLIVRDSIDRSYFDLDAIDRGGPVATEDLIFGYSARPREFTLVLQAPDGRRAGRRCTAEDVAQLADLARLIAAAADLGEARDAVDGLTDEELEILGASYGDGGFGRWPELQKPGIYRREHASLAIHTPETTLVTDPQALANSWTTADGAFPSGAISRAQVLLTHTHSDHFDLASILAWTDPETPVIVPHVPRASLLAEDVRAMLLASGQAALAPPWHTRMRIGDVGVEILPFFGEQPTRALPSLYPEARNWGNCFRFDLGDHSVAILVDSGIDATGSMIQALERSVAERGPIDVLMSCCMEFPEAVNPGLPAYMLVVPFAELRRLHRARGSITLGPSGIAEACRAAGAQYFLPYAHGFSGLGMPPRSAEGDNTEAYSLQLIATALRKHDQKTRLIEWNPGDLMRWEHGAPYIQTSV